jgi:large subunit ribosomal protein L11
MEFCKQFNARTQDKAGKICPVQITVYKTNHLNLLLKLRHSCSVNGSCKLKSGSGEPNRKKKLVLLGNKLELLLKMPDLNAFTLESAMSMVVGTAKSMGITVSGDAPFLIKRQN